MYPSLRTRLLHASRWPKTAYSNALAFSLARSAMPRIGSGCQFHLSARALGAVKSYLLADIGEGITECQITSWLVKPGDEVQQFDPICEVQSDKASVEITSRFDGTIRTLHHEVDAMVAVGSALLDIEVDGEDSVSGEPEALESEIGEHAQASTQVSTQVSVFAPESMPLASSGPLNSGLVTPAVRHLLKDLKLDLVDIEGTGKDGRVTKEDVQNHVKTLESESSTPASTPGSSSALTPIDEVPVKHPAYEDRIVPLGKVQAQMMKSMTQALSIPHFLYTNTVDMTRLSNVRKDFATAAREETAGAIAAESTPAKLSALPFILKALSKAATEYPIVNSSLDITSEPAKPKLIYKGAHHIGIAVDTPDGLLVPVVRNVQDHSILSLAAEIKRLVKAARSSRLTPNELRGPTMVVSNIGSIGGQVVSPIILDPNVMILGVGQTTNVPVYEADEHGFDRLVKQEQSILSWSADHRVLDGATVARCAERVAFWLRNPALLGLELK